MPPRKKEKGAEPTRRSARTATQTSSAPPPKPRPAPTKKRAKEEEPKKLDDNTEAANDVDPDTLSAPEPKKVKTGLAIGDKLPEITLLDEDGNSVPVAEIASERGFILFAYPKASTPGCTKQVCSVLFLRVIGLIIF
jgi:thioredoxin-dependent peroxiredoxin